MKIEPYLSMGKIQSLRVIAILCLMALVPACVSQTLQVKPEPILPVISQTTPLKSAEVIQCKDSAIEYLLSVYSKSNDAITKELAIIDKQLSQSTSFCPALQLALILSSPHYDYQDSDKSARLLENLLSRPDINHNDRQFISVILPLLKQVQKQYFLINDINYSIQKHLSQ